MNKLYISIVLLLLPLMGTIAQAPQGFKYQSIIRNVSGDVLANENVNIGITILQGSEEGVEVFTETHDTITNAFGLVNLEIGFSDPTAFAAIEWSLGKCYIQIDINGNIMGAAQLLSVPYALYAGSAGSSEELQDIGLTGSELSISGGSTIDLAPLLVSNDNQTLSISGNELSIDGGNSVTLPNGIDDADNDPTNEIELPTQSVNDANKMLVADGGGNVSWQTNSGGQLVVVDDLTTGGVTEVLSAQQGKVLQTNKLEKNASFGGDVSGTYDNVKIASGAITTTEISNGTITTADLSQMSATNGQLLKWNGTSNAWEAADDVGTKMSEVEVDAMVANNGYLTSEVDGSVSNEIQDLQLSGNILTITDNGSATNIDLTPYLDNTDNQLSEVEVDAMVADNGFLTTEVDGSVSNEIQDLQLVGNKLTITDNGTATEIDLSAYLDDTKLSEAEVDAMVANNGYLTSEVDGSVSNEIQDLQLAGNILTITDNGSATDIDLAPYLDDTDTQLSEVEVDAMVADNGYLTSEVDGSVSNEIQNLQLSGNILTITNNGSATNIDLTPYLDNTDNQTAGEVTYDNTTSGLTATNLKAAIDELENEIDVVDTDTQLSEVEVDAMVADNGYLTSEVDGSMSNEIQDLQLSGNILTITDNGSATDIDLAPYLDNTDNQTAGEVSVTASGNLTSTDAQSALVELQTDIDTQANSIATNATDIGTETTNRTTGDANLQIEVDATQIGSGLGADGSYTANAATNYIASSTSLVSATEDLDVQVKTNADTISSGNTALQTEVDAIETGTGLSMDGTYTANGSANYIPAATDLQNADDLLDTQMKANADNIATNATDISTETSNRTTADSNIQSELDATQTGSGLGTDGSYTANSGTNYIASSTSLVDATEDLDVQVKINSDAIASSITAVGSMTSGNVFADATASGNWLGLGSSAGKIEFDDQTTDEINILNAHVGIGTSTPITPLHIGRETSAGGNAPRILLSNETESSATEDALIQIGRWGHSTSVIGMTGSGAGATLSNNIFVIATEASRGGIDFRTGGAFAGGLVNGTSRLRITDGGSVGIGDNAPDFLLDVAGTFGADGSITTGSDGTDGSLTIYSEQGTTDYAVVLQPHATMTETTTYTFPANNGTANQVLTTDGSGALSWSTTGLTSIADADADTKIQVEESADEDIIRFDVAGIEAMLIDNSGNIGIGVTTPNDILDVSGNIRTDGRIRFADQTNGILENISANGNFQLVANNSFVLLRPRGEQNGGQISIDPTGYTDFYNTSAVITNRIHTNGDSYFNGGNVGIGDDTPDFTLDVAGTFGTDGDATVSGGDVIIGDGTTAKAGAIVLHDADATDSNTTTLVSNADVAADFILTLPANDGDANQVLTTDGSGALSWASIGGNSIADADADTKIQVEESADEDIIRFDVAGTEAMLIDNFGNLSLNTSNPSDGKLTIATDGNTDETLISFDEGNIGGSAGSNFKFVGKFSGAGTDNAFALEDFNGNTNMVWTAGGNVGIGDDTPDFLLDVAGTFGADDTITTGSNGTDGSLTIYSEQGTTDYSVVVQPHATMTETTTYTLPANNGDANQVLTTDGSGALSWTTTSLTSIADADADTKIQVEESADEDHIRFDVGGSEAIVIDANANMGVGITDPRYRLHIANTASNLITSNGNRGIAITATNGPRLMWEETSGTSGERVMLQRYEAGIMAFDSHNDFGSSPVNRHILVVDNDAKVGINKQTPSVELDVVGDAAISGNTTVSDITVNGGDATIGKGSIAKAGTIVLHDADATDSFTTSLAANADVGASFTLTLPADDGTANQVLTTDGLGALSWSSTGGTSITDSDDDTKIQTEENADEDVIRFDLGGTEKWAMLGSRLEPMNTGSSLFIGNGAGANDDLSGNPNVFIGTHTGYSNTTGGANTGVGPSVLRLQTTGIGNTAMGYYTLVNNRTGGGNSGYGLGALQTSESGNDNTAIGVRALFSINTGSYNTALGVGSGYNSTGSRNIFIGYGAGYNETGSNRLYIDNSNTSSPLIYGKFDSDSLIVNGDFRATKSGIFGDVVINNDAVFNTANTAYNDGSIELYRTADDGAYIDFKNAAEDADWRIQARNDLNMLKFSGGNFSFTDGNVGIGTTDPTQKLHVYDDTDNDEPLVLAESTGDVSLQLAGGSSGSPGEVYLELAPQGRTEGNGWGIGTDDATNLEFGYGGLGHMNKGLVAMTIESTTGEVGIGTETPGSELVVSADDENVGLHIINMNTVDASKPAEILFDRTAITGGTQKAAVGVDDTSRDFFIWVNGSDRLNISETGSIKFASYGAGTLSTDASGNITASSDERLKNISGSFTKGLVALKGLQPINYKWIAESGFDTTGIYSGFSAQNVKAFIPEAIGEDDKGYLTLSDRPILAASVNAVKELNTEVEDLKKQIEQLKAERDTLNTKLEEMSIQINERLSALENKQ